MNMMYITKINFINDSITEINHKSFNLKNFLIHQGCKCNINNIIYDIIDKKYNGQCITFQSGVNYNVFYIIPNSILPIIHNKCLDMHPCRTFNGKIQYNCFTAILSDKVHDIIKLKNKDTANIMKGNKNGYYRNQWIKNDNDHGNVHAGFTMVHLPKNPNYYYLGVVQEKNKKYDRTHFNMVGGRKIVRYDDENNIFLIESNDECAIRKLKEDVDIHISKKTFSDGLELSQKMGINPYKFFKYSNLGIYYWFVPNSNKYIKDI